MRYSSRSSWETVQIFFLRNHISEKSIQSRKDKNRTGSGYVPSHGSIPSDCSLLTNLVDRQFRPENLGNVRQRLGIRIKEWSPNTPANLNFYRCLSTSNIQQAGRNIGRDKPEYVLLAKLAYMKRWQVVVKIFAVSHQRKNVRASSYYRCFHNIVIEDFPCVYA